MTSADDARPRPQYGEYATPEEQLARIRQPLPPSFTPAPPPEPTPPSREQAFPSPWRTVDRAVAVALLVYGLFSIVQGIPALLDPTPLLAALGLDAGEIGVHSTGAWGVVAAVVLIVGWLATAWLTWIAYRRGMILFWIPLAGGIVCNAISGIIVSIALLSDPAVFQAVMERGAR